MKKIILLAVILLTGCLGNSKEPPKDFRPAAGCQVVETSKRINQLVDFERAEMIARDILKWNRLSDWSIWGFSCGKVLILRRNGQPVAMLFKDGSIVIVGNIDPLQISEDTRQVLVKEYIYKIKELEALKNKTEEQ